MIAEVAGGLLSGSLALLADAGHMLTDFAALSLAWCAFLFATKPANARHTFGFGRLSILAAFVNGLALFVVALLICAEAIERFADPAPILAGPMLVIAIIGLAVNCLVFWILIGADRDNLNIRGAILHVLGDLLGSVAAIIAALVILKTGWTPIDPLLSVLVALLILKSAWVLVKDSGHILLEGSPAGLDPDTIVADIKAHIAAITDVTDCHIWSITQEDPVITLSVTLNDRTDHKATKSAIKTRLENQFGISRVTLEIV